MAESASIQLPYNPPPPHEKPAPLAHIYGKPIPGGMIRTVQIIDVGPKGFLRCKINVQPVAKATYSAVSYTWNPALSISYQHASGEDKAIRINGEMTLVPEKVADILYLAHQRGRSSIWIDGLCINQADPEDKKTQVKQMGDVYWNSLEVITFFNAPDKDTDFLFDEANWADETFEANRSAMHKTMRNVLANDYWRRTWVLQELLLARKILFFCGKRAITYHQLGTLFRRLRSTTSSLTQFGKSAVGSVMMLLKGSAASDSDRHNTADGGNFSADDMDIFFQKGRARFRDMQYLELMEQSRRFNRCFDPKDMIYARRALATDGSVMVPEDNIKYGKHTLEEVYKDFAAIHIEKTPPKNCLDVITFASWMTADDLGLPSWIPDWRQPTKSWKDTLNEEELLKLTWSNERAVVSSDRNELTVQGRVLATVTTAHTEVLTKERGATQQRIRDKLSTEYPTQMAGLFPDPIKPVAGDLVCALAGCPALVYLHRDAREEKYTIVAKEWHFHRRAARVCLSDLVVFDEGKSQVGIKRGSWKFKDLGAVNSLAEQRFTIV